MRTQFNARNRGFSLIEVLIAVVILSIGLLALASLQLSLIRSSADTKAQSIAMALAKQRLELERSYQKTGGTDNTCISPVAGSTNTCYRAITDEALAVVDGDPSVAGNQPVGGITFSRQIDVARYVYNKADLIKQFVLQTGDTALDSTLQTNPVTYLAGKEFKRITATVSWTDSTGTLRSIVAEDAIASIDPADSASVSKANSGAAPRPARAVITNPASVAGVIPIAIGNGSDTAATNPRPVIISQGNNSTVVETRFDIYTYAAINGVSAEAQSRVETSVVGCRCSKTAATHVANRPTYWNGFQYTVPTTANNVPVSVQATGNSVVQSQLCDSCCRDHFDPSGVTGAKFDPRRSAHNHFLSTDTSNAVGVGEYNEACRLIRVDGIFYVAPDPYDDDLMLLATNGLSATTPTTVVADAVPGSGTGSTSALYQTFVLNYLSTRFGQTTKANYNTPVDPTQRTNYTALQLPATAGLSATSSPKYTHARGLYIDYLEPEVQDIVKAAFDNCIVTPVSDCYLKYLPFTSINITELANWTSTQDTRIGVSNNGFPTTIDDPLPVRGKATLKVAASLGDTANAVAAMQRSSAGLAVTNDIFPSSQISNSNVPENDQQAFIVGVVSNSNNNGQYFNVTLAGASLLATLTAASPADVRFSIATQATCNANPVNQVATYKCIPNVNESLPAAANISVGNYNRDQTVAINNPCSNSAAVMAYKRVFDVTSATYNSNTPTSVVTLNNSTGSIVGGGEYTTFTAATPPLQDQNTLTVTFGSPSYLCPSNWSTFITDSGAAVNFTNTQKQANCSGNGNKDPNFNTTFTSSCPTGFSPFNGQ